MNVVFDRFDLHYHLFNNNNNNNKLLSCINNSNHLLPLLNNKRMDKERHHRFHPEMKSSLLLNRCKLKKNTGGRFMVPNLDH